MISKKRNSHKKPAYRTHHPLPHISLWDVFLYEVIFEDLSIPLRIKDPKENSIRFYITKKASYLFNCEILLGRNDHSSRNLKNLLHSIQTNQSLPPLQKHNLSLASCRNDLSFAKNPLAPEARHLVGASSRGSFDWRASTWMEVGRMDPNVSAISKVTTPQYSEASYAFLRRQRVLKHKKTQTPINAA